MIVIGEENAVGWSTKVAIVGSGPSALSLSFILNGNIPYYDPVPYGPHPDESLHYCLLNYTAGNDLGKSLLDAVADEHIISYMESSYESFFSDQTLPVNLLIDALSASDESSFMNCHSKECRIKWVHESAKYVPHIVIGSSPRPGGQWGSYEFDSKDQLSLSYAEMLSLPGYSFSQYYMDTYGTTPADFYRPPRHQVADYYAMYPGKVGISENIVSNTLVTCVDRASHTGSFVISMRQCEGAVHKQCLLAADKVVLATGVYESPLESLKSASPKGINENNGTNTTDLTDVNSNGEYGRHDKTFYNLTNALVHNNSTSNSNSNSNSFDKHHFSFTIVPPLSTPPSEGARASQNKTCLIIGTGVSAAEAVNNSIALGYSVIHIYKWYDEKGSPCVFRRYPKELYPDYCKVFRMMKQRKVAGLYEGLPNAQILDISPDGMVEIKLEDGSTVCRTVSSVRACTGRTGSLSYLCNPVLDRSIESTIRTMPITKKTLRDKYIDKNDQSLCVGENVYAIGSLCGDTVVRFMLGASFSVAGELVDSSSAKSVGS
ncbi:hypothetical protein AWJ20_4875 [Sugiyamaella lignohabitans]|uniref:L-ornithine N(5)-oxygenase n=1 Tax=Sugiyamaella lignohabitans TaxID=796027 RepID=A0A167ED39_9ASCO|nr:uncharacterized protein AWJ20_4875 [Sugiyamaella lignohabitans]ANB13924.1 hypothetical protein AWJ20_4875 [Sugiyamaella lignohabitans]